MPRLADVPDRIPSPSDQLAQLVRSCGRSPAAIAAAAGVAPSILSRFLNGSSGISSGTLDRIASALGGLRLTPIGKARPRPRPPAGDGRAANDASGDAPILDSEE